MDKSHVYNLATSICQKLFDAGYTAYFAGGWVRDLLLEHPQKEIDIATNAPPAAVQKLFPKTIPVGIAFGVLIVVLEGINFEVTTFRKDHPYHDGRHPDGVDFSTPEKDALRRDFTINALFYDPLTETLYDFIGGEKDLRKKVIRAIGDPNERFTEDRLRMLRAVRFSVSLGFHIERATEEAIISHAEALLPAVSMERVWQEFNKMRPLDLSLVMLQKLNLLPIIFPALKGVAVEEIQRRVAPFPYFPIETPTILYLAELFFPFTLEERSALTLHLKTSAKEEKILIHQAHLQTLLRRTDVSLQEWAHHYALPDTDLLLYIEAAKLPVAKRKMFLEEHNERRKKLARHIQRIREKKPLVRAALLTKHGIEPGKRMGRLLKEAERIAIEDDLNTPEEVLERLKTTPYWA